jgi:hypothetical protein
MLHHLFLLQFRQHGAYVPEQVGVKISHNIS